MKKILFGLTLMAAMASCTEDYKDWASPANNPQEPVKSVEVEVTSAGTINLADAEESVQLFTPSVVVSDEAVSKYTVELYAEAEGARKELTADSEGKVLTADLQDAVVSLCGARPVERSLFMDITCLTNIAGQSIQNVSKNVAIKITPKAPFIDSGYYLTGDFAGWNKEGALAFTHIGSGDVYDNPEFQIMFTATADNQYWKIISKTNYDNDFWAEGETGVVGTKVDGDTSAEGLLTTDHPQAGKIEKAGIYMLTINMMEYSFTIKAVAPQFYMVGALPGWNAEGAAKALLYPQTNTTMQYTSKFTGAWDLKLWNKNDLGNWDACYGCEVDGDNSANGKLINSNAQAISSPSAEYYTFTVDLAAMTYSWTKLANQNPTEYTKMGIIGDFNGWSTDEEMTQVTPHNWYVVATVTDGGLKFRANADWGINWGAELTVSDSDFYGKGVQDGANITVPAGTYAFYINDITGDFAIVKQ